MVWTHLRTKSLLLGATADYVEGLSVEASRALLARLRDWATQPHYVYRHEWQVGDLLMWDNTGTMHRALPYALDSGRLMHRIILAGEEPPELSGYTGNIMMSEQNKRGRAGFHRCHGQRVMPPQPRCLAPDAYTLARALANSPACASTT
jgi:hypothetical protein